MVIGGQAVLFYGEPRMTRDIDITLGLSPEETNKVLDLIEECGLNVLVDNPLEFARETMVLPACDIESPVRVDFIFSLSEYEKEAMKRTVPVKILGEMIRFVSPEDLIIHKLVAGRPRDIEDIRMVLLKNTQVDSGYILRWLKDFDISLDASLESQFTKLRDSLS